MADHSADPGMWYCPGISSSSINGIIEQKRGAGLNGKLAQEATHLNSVEEAAAEAESANNDLARPKLFVFNIILTIAVIALLIKDIFPSYVPFMIGVAHRYPGKLSRRKDAEEDHQSSFRSGFDDVFYINGRSSINGYPC